MALMKTGRNSEPPNKKKGVEPSKAQQEVKVTAKKQYTWDDYYRNEDIKARNKAAKEKYESDVASYNKAIKLYNEGASYDDVSNESLSMINKSGSKIKGKPVTYTAATGGTSAKEMSDAYEKGIKSGEYVDINDPRISEKNRYYLKGTFFDSTGEESNKWGTVKSKAIPASVAFDKDLNWKKLYGGEDFDPYEYQKASKSGKFDEYVNKKGIAGKSFMPSYGGHLEKYGKPEQAKVPAYEKEENIDMTKLPREPLQKLPLKPVQKIDQKISKLSIPKKVEKEIPTWEEPSGGVRTKTRIVKATNQSLGDYIGGNIKYAVSKVTGGEPGLRGGVKKTRTALIQGKSGREAKEFKAYYGAPASESGSDRSGMTASDIAQERESLKGVKKQLRADIKKATPEYTYKSDLKSELRNVRKDIRATKKAERYAEKNIEARSIYTNGKEEVVVRGKEDAKSKIYNPSLGEQYSAYSKYIKSSTDNPVNKNKTFGRKVK